MADITVEEQYIRESQKRGETRLFQKTKVLRQGNVPFTTKQGKIVADENKLQGSFDSYWLMSAQHQCSRADNISRYNRRKKFLVKAISFYIQENSNEDNFVVQVLKKVEKRKDNAKSEEEKKQLML